MAGEDKISCGEQSSPFSYLTATDRVPRRRSPGQDLTATTELAPARTGARRNQNRGVSVASSDFATGMKCRVCGKLYPKSPINFCVDDFGPLEVAYDYDRVRANLT